MEDNPTKAKRIRFSISKKLLLSFVLLTVLICAVTTISGYFQYDNTIRKLYNDNGYVIANIILDQVDHDRIAKYAQTWEADEYYGEMADYLKSVEEASGAAYIYIVTISPDHTMRYIYDSSGLSIGDTDPLSSYFDEAWAAYTQGVKPDNYMVRHSAKYGFLTSSMVPVTDSKGNIAAVLLVDVWMEVIMSTLRGYIVKAILFALGTLVLFSIAYWFFMRKSFIGPLMRIRGNVTEFAQHNTETTISLDTIRTNDEIQELAESIGMMENDIIQYIDNIQSITAEKERISTELNVATQIQADMLPRIFPAFPNRSDFELYASMTPAKEVGGDFYDFFLIDDDHIGLVMADVSGKGVPAALFMVIAKTLIKNRTMMGGSPAEILSYVNNQLCEGNDAGLFVTVWLAIVELSTGKGMAANAGHEHPVLKHADGDYELVKYRHSPAVATMEGMRFKEHEFQLRPGDCLYVYTDGVPDAERADGARFGTDLLIEAMNRMKEKPVAELLPAIKEEIDRFANGFAQFDDITMLGFQYHGPAGDEKTLRTPARRDQVQPMLDFLEEFLTSNGVPMKTTRQILLAGEETIVNVANYAYPEQEGEMELALSAKNGSVTMTLTDSGIPFDPTAKEDPDVTLSAEDRPIGGLGIYMTKKLMDAVEYRRDGDRNILTIRKQYS